ncbi:39S ribosomal protein L21, mitochondrial-like [Anopheles albimanus]|uniref:Large ribosomal subunit protein bL21m n=1 Tax=Anopheles albimanus TaxID=7167 RepID=A0A182FT90_ANOAL|nr:39S ribosomal protein L21, mitochondrial-like [Anopheles albimanus]
MFLKQFSRLLKPATLGAFTEPLKRLPALAAAPAFSASRWNPTFALNNPLRWSSSSAVVPLADKSTTETINKQLETGTEGRLFAVVQLCGKQFKITAGDIIVVEGYWPPENGDRLRLDKVLLAGGSDFSLIGRPLLAPGLVDVQATIVEKTLSHTRTHFRKKRRKQYMRINFYRSQQTMIRINSIDITRKLGDSGAPEASGERFF